MLFAFLICSKTLISFFFNITVGSSGGSFNPLSLIFKENKLTDPNYVDWKRNMTIVLNANEYKYVLSDPVLRLGKIPQMRKLERLKKHGRKLTKWLVILC